MDIDAYACAVAYAELLCLEGYDARAEFSDPLNASVTPSLRNYQTKCSPRSGSQGSYVIVDLSDPEVISKFAPLDRIVEVYDHHFGFEAYWAERIGESAKIERIGAAATLVWEEYVTRGYADRIGEVSAALLAHAVISNSVNFTLDMTTDRDRAAARALVARAGLTDGWEKRYFEEQQEYVEANPRESVRDDTKHISLPGYGSVAFAQIEIWDAERFARRVPPESVFADPGSGHWIFNCVDISRGRTTIRSSDPSILAAFERALGGKLGTDGLSFDRVVLRKEFLPLLRRHAGLTH
jgi:inorganic pyrophosphatase